MSIVLKTLADLERRELFVIGNQPAVYVQQFEGGVHGFVVLNGLRFETRSNPDEPVVSYGKDWFLDVDGVTFTDEAAGGVYIGPNGPLIAAQGEKALLWLDAATAEPAPRPAALASAGGWWVWATREDWASPNGSSVAASDDGDE